nr:serine/threonine-protein kinase [Frankia canadensis]
MEPGAGGGEPSAASSGGEPSGAGGTTARVTSPPWAGRSRPGGPTTPVGWSGSTGGTRPGGTGPGGPIAPLERDDPIDLDRVELLGRLGEGGMGTVFLGRGRPNAPGYAGRLVAAKVIRPDLARVSEFRARFRREADIARRVARFCTAEVLDVVDPPDGLPYLVTEYIDGLTLAQSVATEGPLRSADLERLAVSVAAALTSIHGAGMVHRDLKPSNVLLSSLGPRVIDFGIARALDAQTMLSQEIQRIGTPAFMAPEQANGEPVTAAADVFAWGGLVTYAGTGSFPFGDGPTPVQLYRVVHREPLLDGLDPALRPIVEEAMRKDPAARPSAQELFLRLVGMGPSTHPDPDLTRVLHSSVPIATPPQRTDTGAGPSDPGRPGRAASTGAAPAPGDRASGTPRPHARAWPGPDAGQAAVQSGPGAAGRPHTGGTGSSPDHGSGSGDVDGVGGGYATRTGPRPSAGAGAGQASGTGREVAHDAAGPAAWPDSAGSAGFADPTRSAESARSVHSAHSARIADSARFTDSAGIAGSERFADSPRLAHPAGPADRTGFADPAGFAMPGTLGAAAGGDGSGGTAVGVGPAPTEPATRPHRRWSRRRVALLAAPVLAVLLITALVPLALTSGGDVRPSRQETAARVALAAEAVRNSDADLAARLSLAAYRISPVREARAALRTSFASATATVLPGHTASALGVDISPNGRLLASTGADDLVALWSIADRAHPERLATLNAHHSWVLDAAFSPDNRLLATVSYDRSAILWDVSDPRHPVQLSVILGHDGWVLDAAFSPDGRILATSGYDNTARLWDVTDPRRPRELSVLDRHTSWVNEVAFSPDGRLLATASADRTARLWDVADPRHPRPLAAITAHTDYVWTVAFSPDGRRLATGGYDGTARLWDIADPSRPKAVASFPADEKWVFDLAFSPDGRTLATAGWDTTVHLWDVSGPGRPPSIGTINGHGDWIQAVDWTPDGSGIATASDDYTVRISRVDDASLIAAACADPSKEISAAEWRRYISDVPYQPVC